MEVFSVLCSPAGGGKMILYPGVQPLCLSAVQKKKKGSFCSDFGSLMCINLQIEAVL